jgi:CHAT domain-containing protein
MNTNELRRRRNDAMRDFDDGNLPQTEAEITALISQNERSSDPWTVQEIASCLQNRATVRRFSNRWQEALDDLSRSERLALRLPLLPRRLTLPGVYHARASLLAIPYSDVYNLAEAAKAVAELRKYPGPAWMADSLEADIAFTQRAWDKAAALYLKTADSLQKEGWMQGVASCRSRAGESLVELQDWTAAEPQLNDSVAFLEKLGSPDILANARLNLARIRAARGESDQAWDLALQALSGIESMVRHFRDVSEQQQFLANKLRFYDRAFEIAQTKTGPEGQWRAWTIVERAKSFYLCQLVANAEIKLFEGVDPTDIAQLENLDAQLDETERMFSLLALPDKHGPRGQEMQEKIRSVSQQKRSLLTAMMKQNPRWAALKTPPAFDSQSELARLNPEWVVVSYFWVVDTSENTSLHIFWTGPDRLPQSISIPWTAHDLQLLDQLRLRLRGQVSPGETPFPAELASKVLPQELLQSLAAESRMLISPHEHLKGIPLQCVPINDDQLLVQKVPVQFIPTLTLLPLESRAAPAEKILLLGCPKDGFGDVPLEEVETEIAGLARIWQAQRPGKVKDCILPPDARPKELELGPEHWSEFGLLHFACHGVFPEGMPFDASLRLGRQAIRASELFSAHLAKACVFLSACSLGRQEDGSGKPAAGDEWVGLYLPLFYSGAQQLLVSLYDADSATTMRIMLNVHTSLSKGAGLASALQLAINAEIREGIPPTLWANWYLVGLPA